MPDNASLLRSRDNDERARVTNVELFFDLVFAFAITQLSHSLLHQLSAGGALRTTLLMLAVWWVWIYTAWVTNWLDPERAAVRLLLFALMLAGLVLSASIPEAFEHAGLQFACAYVFMQMFRTLFMLAALRGRDRANLRNFQRITIWLALSATFWIAGALSHERTVLWSIALLIEYLSPAAGFAVPGLGKSNTTDWSIEGGHLAERCSQFVLIALGESILVTGATAAELPVTAATLSAFLAAFAGSVAMWWIYFNIGAERTGHHIEKSADPGRLARSAYTYVHVLIVAGVVVCAVADEVSISHPSGPLTAAAAAVFLGGPALYLVGNLLFKRGSAANLPLSHLIGLALLGLLACGVSLLNPLTLGAATTAVLLLVAAWETLSFHSKE